MSSTKGKTFGASSVSLTQAAATLRANIETEMQRYKGGSLKKLFDGYDANQSGVLNALEFESMVSHLVVYPVSLNNLRKLFKEIDEDQDGSIDFTEFESFIKRSVRDDRKNQKGAEYQDRKWKNGVGRHRKSIVSDRDEGRDEGGDTVSDLKTTSTLFSPTRSRQIYFTKTKQHHTTKHRKASSLGGFMAKGQGHDTGQDRLISPSALDAATALKPIGPAADQSLGNRREIAITKLSLALRTRNEELQTVFDKADHNHDGELQPEEFTEMVERFLPGEISRTEIFEVMKIMDLDGNGAVSFSEFRDGIFRNPVKFRSPHRARTKVDPVRKERKSIQSTEDGVGTSKKALTGLTVPTLDNQRGCPFVGAKKGKNNQNKKSKKESN
jgi:Ca2+-binding EF-hand superfamily protein